MKKNHIAALLVGVSTAAAVAVGYLLHRKVLKFRLHRQAKNFAMLYAGGGYDELDEFEDFEDIGIDDYEDSYDKVRDER